MTKDRKILMVVETLANKVTSERASLIISVTVTGFLLGIVALHMLQH